MKTALAVLALLALTGPAAHATAAGQPVNPLVRQRADPQIYRDETGQYYFTATVPEYDRIVLRRAATIAGLSTARERVIWRRHRHGAMASHIWAPEIHRLGGKWYIYFTAGRSDDIWAVRLYVLENASADPLRGRWVEKGQLRTGFESFTLDATTFTLRGQQYLVWAQRPLQPRDAGTSLYIARLQNPWTLQLPQVEISAPMLDWEIRGFKVNEAPAVLLRHGRVFLSYSASATDARYCMGLLTAANDADLLQAASWSKSQVPVFTSSARHGQYGPGHNSYTVAEDGHTDVLVYHARNYAEIKGDPLHDPNRHTRVQTLGWAADGTPAFGEPVPDGPVALSPR